MKNLSFIAVILVSIAFMACGGSGKSDSTSNGKPVSSQVLNESAMKIFQAANTALDEFDPKITAGIKSKDLASIATAAAAATAIIDAEIEKLNAINAPQEGEGYKNAVLKCLDEAKSIVETGKKYSELKEGYSKSEFNALEKEYNNKRQILSKSLLDVAKEQKAFMNAK